MPPAPPARHYFLFDTGPLLGFAVASTGPALLKTRYAGRAGVVSDVDADLRGLQRGRSPVADAARRATTAYPWLDRHLVDDETVLARAEDLRARLQAFKRHPRRPNPHNRQDWGECVTLAQAEVLAMSSRIVVVVANEDAARALAMRLPAPIPTATAVDILWAMVHDKTLTRKQAYTIYRDIVGKIGDAGDVIGGARVF